MWQLAIQIIDSKKTNIPTSVADNGTLKTILTDVFVLLGAISFFMIVVAGLQYILARGNAEKITTAKNKIQYSLMGLIIAALAASMVNIAINRLQ